MSDTTSETASVAVQQSGPVPSSIPGYAVTPGMGGPPPVVSAIDRVNKIVESSPAMKSLWAQMPVQQKMGIAMTLINAGRNIPQAQVRPQSARDMDAALYGAAGSALGNMGAKYPYTSMPGQPGIFSKFEGAAVPGAAPVVSEPAQSPWVIDLLKNIGIDLPGMRQAAQNWIQSNQAPPANIGAFSGAGNPMGVRRRREPAGPGVP